MLVRALRNRRVLAGVWFVLLPALSFGVINVLAPLRLHALGVGAAGIGAIWLVTAGLESIVGPIVGHEADKRGRFALLRVGLVATAIAMTGLAVLDTRWWLLAPCIAATGVAVGIFWAPAMSLLSDEAERTGLDYAFGFTLVNLAWGSAQIAGAAGGASLAQVTADAVPYLAVSGLCVLTFALVLAPRDKVSLGSV
jgi:MFS family permease